MLIFQAAVVGASVILMSILAVWYSLRKSDDQEYSPDLQKL